MPHPHDVDNSLEGYDGPTPEWIENEHEGRLGWCCAECDSPPEKHETDSINCIAYGANAEMRVYYKRCTECGNKWHR